MTTIRQSTVTGFLLAVGSAASFALSGIFASALMESGWSPLAATTARISLAALALLGPTWYMMRGKWDLVRRAWVPIALFGVLGVAACQLAFFLAIQYIPPSLALLIEFLGPVLLMLWMWASTRVAPGIITILGAVIAFIGLVTISGVAVGAPLHPLGILFALVAAVGVATYFAVGARSDHDIPALPFVGLGLLAGAVSLVIVDLFGVLEFTISDAPVRLGGTEMPAWVAVAGMVFISTVLAYALGVSASRILGATVASFTGYSEPLFGILWTIVLLAIIPTGTQWIGAALIVGGVVTVKLGEVYRARKASHSRTR